MKDTLNTYVVKIKNAKHARRRIISFIVALALIVSCAVYWQLRTDGIAMANETFCGMEEHLHGDECYESVLVCGFEEDKSGTGHTHDATCYDKVLICEKQEHTHSVSCFINENADVEYASDWEATLPEELTGVWADDVVAVAHSQLGYAESEQNFTLAEDGEKSNGYTRYGAWYGNEYGDWDAMFVSFVLHYAGVPEEIFPQAAGAYAWMAEFDRIESEDETGETHLYADSADYEPNPGDLVIFDTDGDGAADRVGIVTGTDYDDIGEALVQITVIEGDFDDAVCENEYAPDEEIIMGYGILPESEKDSLVTYSASGGGVEVSVTVASGALPENAELQVIRYDEDSEACGTAIALVDSAKESDNGIRTLSDPDSRETEDRSEEEGGSLSFRLSDEEDTISGTVLLDIFFS